MKENRYDEEQFFAKYSAMPRSTGGLSAAGEWLSLRAMLPSFAEKDVLDLGCGFGWHCIYAAEQGARSVTGVDISERMLAVAREKTDSPVVRYLRRPIEDIDFPENSFDIALSSLALHYVPSFGAVCAALRRCLRPGGDFVFSVEHPVFTAYGDQDWYRDEAGAILHWPVDRYFAEGQRDAVFLGEHITKYHRTLTTYLRTLFEHGFDVLDVCEPQPSEEMLRAQEGMRDERRRPMMLLIAARVMHNA